MGRLWCQTDPTVRVGSHTIQVEAYIQAAHAEKLAGAILYTITRPRGMEWEVIDDGSTAEPVNGYLVGLIDAEHDGDTVELHVEAPSRAGRFNMLIMVTVDGEELTTFNAHNTGADITLELEGE